MSESNNTLAGLIQMNDQNLSDIMVTDLFQNAPFLKVLFAQAASNGTLHKYLKTTAAPGVGYREINAGITNAAGQKTLVSVVLELIDGSFTRDIALALGFSGGMEQYIENETEESLIQTMFVLEQQALNGTNAIAAGSEGLADALANLNNAQVVDAGGSAAATGSSVYLVRSARNGVSFVMGNDGQLIQEAPERVRVLDGSSKPYTGILTTILGYGGLQLGSTYDSCRIANITEDSTKGLTDDLVAKGLAKFKAGSKPNYIVANTRSIEQLRLSRTATNITGNPAPTPVEVFGYPLINSDAISNTETILTT
jgi:hypothetical protein